LHSGRNWPGKLARGASSVSSKKAPPGEAEASLGNFGFEA
jgi:hypothetical protein